MFPELFERFSIRDPPNRNWVWRVQGRVENTEWTLFCSVRQAEMIFNYTASIALLWFSVSEDLAFIMVAFLSPLIYLPSFSLITVSWSFFYMDSCRPQKPLQMILKTKIYYQVLGRFLMVKKIQGTGSWLSF